MQTGKKLYNPINTRVVSTIATDYWRAYEKFIPAKIHIRSKAETYTIEGYNSLFRHFLARMRIKSKCYSKSVKMLEISIKLLMLKWNGELSILD